jgi:hypothetical protein
MAAHGRLTDVQFTGELGHGGALPDPENREQSIVAKAVGLHGGMVRRAARNVNARRAIRAPQVRQTTGLLATNSTAR